MNSRLTTLNRITIFFGLMAVVDSIDAIPFTVAEVYALAFGGILSLGYSSYFGAKSYERKK